MLAPFLFAHPPAHFLLTLVVYNADCDCTASYDALKDIEKLTTEELTVMRRSLCPHSHQQLKRFGVSSAMSGTLRDGGDGFDGHMSQWPREFVYFFGFAPPLSSPTSCLSGYGVRYGLSWTTTDELLHGYGVRHGLSWTTRPQSP